MGAGIRGAMGSCGGESVGEAMERKEWAEEHMRSQDMEWKSCCFIKGPPQ